MRDERAPLLPPQGTGLLLQLASHGQLKEGGPNQADQVEALLGEQPGVKCLWVGAGVFTRGQWDGYPEILEAMLKKHGRTPHCDRCHSGEGEHSRECRARFEAIWTKELGATTAVARDEPAAVQLVTGQDLATTHSGR